MPSYTSTPCLTSRHRSCADLACRCRCHEKADGTNRGPGPDRTVGKLTSPPTTGPNFWRDYNALAARRRLERAGVVLPDSDTVSPADQARLADPSMHPCTYCSKLTEKEFTICQECFDLHEKGKTAEERREQRAER
jgi:hypothetical protein